MGGLSLEGLAREANANKWMELFSRKADINMNKERVEKFKKMFGERKGRKGRKSVE